MCYTCNHFVLGFVEFDPIAAYNAAVYLMGIAEDFGPPESWGGDRIISITINQQATDDDLPF